jgi:hypothetical protein
LFAQEAPQAKPASPQVRVNYLNVCTPSDAEKAEILSALDHLPAMPRFGSDFEIARGRSTSPEDAVAAGPGAKMSGPPAVSRWVRIRKEFTDASPYLNVQYSFSVASDTAEEALVFRVREPKDVMQVSLSNSAALLANPAQAVTAQTPVDRIRLERFGRSSLVLARCKNADQSAYEPLFQKASEVFNRYREQLGARSIVAQDLPKTAEKPAAPSGAKPKPRP